MACSGGFSRLRIPAAYPEQFAHSSAEFLICLMRRYRRGNIRAECVQTDGGACTVFPTAIGLGGCVGAETGKPGAWRSRPNEPAGSKYMTVVLLFPRISLGIACRPFLLMKEATSPGCVKRGNSALTDTVSSFDCFLSSRSKVYCKPTPTASRKFQKRLAIPK